MESTFDAVPAKRKRIEGKEKTQIPQETMFEVLLWLDRFDLDGKQITARRLCSLVEHKQMPLRKVDRVDYDGVWRYVLDSPGKINSLSICREQDEGNGPVKVELPIDGNFLPFFLLRARLLRFGHYDVLPEKPIIAAPALVRALDFQYCNFDNGETDALSDTLNGSTFQRLALVDSALPAWQIDDKRLVALRRRGCNAVRLRHDADPFKVTEEGLLAYCFTIDDDLPAPERRSLDITSANITPAFFKKVIEASMTIQLTCDVELRLDGLQFEVESLDLGVQPSRSTEYDEEIDADVHHVRYSFADLGKGIRLLIHFQCDDGDNEWFVTISRKKRAPRIILRTSAVSGGVM